MNHEKSLYLLCISSFGNATLTEPEGGWNFTALQDIFSVKAAKSNDALINSSPTPTPSSTSNKPPSSNSHKGAIAGGVVGGVLGVIFIGALILIASKRRRREDGSQAPKSIFSRKSRTKPGFLHKLINPHDPVTHYEKDAQHRAELSPADRFEIGGDNNASADRFEIGIGGDNSASAAHELDDTNRRK